MLDDPWGLDERREPSRGGDDVLWTEDGSKLIRALNTILEAQDRRVGADDRLVLLRRVFGAEGFRAEEGELDRADLQRLIRGMRGLHEKIPECALDLQSVLAHSLKMRAACNEMNFMAGSREQGSIVATDAAGADYSDLHGVCPRPSKGIRSSAPTDTNEGQMSGDLDAVINDHPIGPIALDPLLYRLQR